MSPSHAPPQRRRRRGSADSVSSDSTSSTSSSSSSSSSSSDSSDSDSSLDDNDFEKQLFVLHIDDDVDEDVMASLLDPRPPVDVLLCNTEVSSGQRRGSIASTNQ
jgi:hypothetical protein